MDKIIKRVIEFRDKRNWKQFHSPQNLSKSIMIEAAELLQNYQCRHEPESIDNVKDEIADVLIYCILLCEHYNFDLETIINHKIDKNEKKYPVEKAYGKSDKYNNLL
ncbi:MAG TPA: nucleotide pyrophosphohydrolase [Bacilli bacterium]|nr:nucleotide pyrophosphohydrolase [Bacilli bacterium]